MGCSSSSNVQYNYADESVNANDPSIKELDSGPFFFRPNLDFAESVKQYEDLSFGRDVPETLKKFSSNPFLGYRRTLEDSSLENNYTFLTYGQVYNYALRTVIAMRNYKLHEDIHYEEESKNYSIVGIYSGNKAEWLITDLACSMDNVTTATYYSTLGDEAFNHISDLTRLNTIFIGQENVSNFLKYKAKYDLEHVKNIVIFDLFTPVPEDVYVSLQKTGLTIHSFKKLVEEVAEEEVNKLELNLPKPDDLMTICFTSGTTGLPKGVKITHRMIASEMAVLESSNVSLSSNARHLSFLPLAHIMERIVYIGIMTHGARLGFVYGNLKETLADHIMMLRPTFLVAVPKLLADFRTKIMNTMSRLTGCSKSIADSAFQTKKENFLASNTYTHWWHDSLAFKKVREKFGGCIEFFICGSAPLPVDLANDIKILFSCPIVEGYGMTETTGGALATNLNDPTNGHVGGAVSCTAVKLEGVKELNYTNKTELDGKRSPCGEVCIKGPVCTPGYFRDAKNTAELIDSDGWLHTGDIGRLMPNGTIKIIDRRKEIFKLSQGEYIAPTKLEDAYGNSKYVQQICIYGDSHKTFVVGIVVPNRNNIKTFLVEKKLVSEDANYSELDKFFEDEALQKEIIEDLAAIHKKMGFNSLEKVPKVIISHEEFNHDKNELLTPTQKMVRKKIKEFFEKEIELAYA